MYIVYTVYIAYSLYNMYSVCILYIVYKERINQEIKMNEITYRVCPSKVKYLLRQSCACVQQGPAEQFPTAEKKGLQQHRLIDGSLAAIRSTRRVQ